MKINPILIAVLLSLPSASAADVYVFSSPENSLPALSFFAGSQNLVNISVYEFTSPDIMFLFSKKADKLLVEKSPVSGMKDIEKKILCNFEDWGTEVKLYLGPKRFLHAKYICGFDVLASS